jgi:hypothetical protein
VAWSLVENGQALLALVRTRRQGSSGGENFQLELGTQRSAVGDGKRPLAGATDCGTPPETRTVRPPANGRWVGGIE